MSLTYTLDWCKLPYMTNIVCNHCSRVVDPDEWDRTKTALTLSAAVALLDGVPPRRSTELAEDVLEVLEGVLGAELAGRLGSAKLGKLLGLDPEGRFVVEYRTKGEVGTLGAYWSLNSDRTLG